MGYLLSLDSVHFGWLVAFHLAGLTALTLGGALLCRGAVGLALGMNLRPVVVGLTVVSLATSSPELFTSLIAGAEGSPGLVLGNIVGSNIANLGLILGVSALICPLVIRLPLIRRDVPILAGVTVLFCLLAWNKLGRWEGGVLLGLGVAYLWLILRKAPPAADAMDREVAEEVEQGARLSLGQSVGRILAGTALLAFGAELLVASSVESAVRLGVSDVLVGITIVAIGTSLPELSTSISAAVMRQADLCAGNLVGSNLFNLVLIGGGVALFFPIPVEPRFFAVEIPALLVFTALLWPFFLSGRVVSRGEGLTLLVLYGVFLVLTYLSQTGVLW